MTELQKSNKQDMVVYAASDSGEIIAFAKVWASNIPDALSRAAEKLPTDIPPYAKISVCSEVAFEQAKKMAEGWYRISSWQPRQGNSKHS
ncbi:hypothetical protein D3C79_971170 [compost metagenome]